MSLEIPKENPENNPKSDDEKTDSIIPENGKKNEEVDIPSEKEITESLEKQRVAKDSKEFEFIKGCVENGEIQLDEALALGRIIRAREFLIAYMDKNKNPKSLSNELAQDIRAAEERNEPDKESLRTLKKMGEAAQIMQEPDLMWAIALFGMARDDLNTTFINRLKKELSEQEDSLPTLEEKINFKQSPIEVIWRVQAATEKAGSRMIEIERLAKRAAPITKSEIAYAWDRALKSKDTYPLVDVMKLIEDSFDKPDQDQQEKSE